MLGGESIADSGVRAAPPEPSRLQKGPPRMSRLSFPSDLFHLREGEKPMYGESPDCKRAVDYFKSLISEDEWVARRAAIAKQFYQGLIGEDAESMLSMMRLKPASNPHFIESLNSAVVCRWVSLSEDAVEKKARDIMKRLSDANDQLPSDVSGVVHIGFEALGADAIEQRRYEKIIDTARRFDRGASGLEVIYCNYFAPDPAPEEVWAIDETVQWIGRGRPLEDGRLLPSGSAGRSGVHWINPV
jgi:hypothetical protein